jgi:predicted dehydrogenase
MKKSKRNETPKGVTRRDFFRTSAAAAAGAAFVMPAIVPACATGPKGPSGKIHFGVIGTGRIAHSMDMPEIMAFDDVQIVAVCDVDSKRMEDARKKVDDHYAKKTGMPGATACAMVGDYRELVQRDDIDAVMICTPDHWHALPAVAAAEAGKDIFIEKPLSLTIKEGRIISDTVRKRKRVFLVGSQQRSDARFRRACELVRNGRIGELKQVKVGLPTDPAGRNEPVMDVPPNLNYDMWLGSTPLAPYTEKRVHPQRDYGRPGWLRIQAYGAGMITGWGSHHNDIAQWGMDTELTGPVAIEARAEFPKSGLWDVHGNFHIEYTYASGVKLICADNGENRQGVTFEGTDGWVHISRSAFETEPGTLKTSEIKPDEVHLYESANHKKNFLECVRSRKETVAPVEIAHRSNSICLLGAIAMNLGRKLRWDPAKEVFLGDEEANGMLARPMRKPWTF